MKLTDQEQVILKAIGSGVAEVSRVIRSVGYPKATVKKALVRLNEKGIVTLHRHDYPQSLTPEQRKMMVRIGRDYYGAVSVRKRNPSKQSKGKTALKKTGRALKGFARGALQSGAEILGAGAMALNPSGKVRFIKGEYKGMTGVIESIIQKRYTKEPTTYRIQIDGFGRKFGKPGGWNGQVTATEDQIESIKSNPLIQPGRRYKMKPDYEPTAIIEAGMRGGFKAVFIAKDGLAGQVGGFKTRQEATTWAKAQGFKVVQKTKKRNKTIIKAKRIDHLDVSKVHNPRKRLKVRNKYIDLVIKGQAKKTPQGWKVGKKTFAQGRGTVSVSSGYYLDKHTGMVYAKRERNKTKKKRNVSEGFYDASGVFHPIRSSEDYSPSTAGETGRKAKRTRSKKKLASKRKASQTARRKRMVAGRKRTTSRLAGRAIKKSSGLLKKGKRRNAGKKVTAKRIATGEGWDFWKIGDDVYRAPSGAGKDTYGLPMGKRWESSYAQFQRYRDSVFGWAKPIGKRNPSAESIRKDFAGSVNGERDLFFPQGTPSGKLAKLGKLVSITTEAGTIKPVHGAAWLCADTKGKLHIGSVSGAPLFDGPARSFGHVTKLEYESSKPHLGYKGPIIWFHKAGEENGIKPTLRADGKGGLVFKGGDYRLTRRGIEN